MPNLEDTMKRIQALSTSVATLQAQEKDLPHENSGKEEASNGRPTKEEKTPTHPNKSYNPETPHPRVK